MGRPVRDPGRRVDWRGAAIDEALRAEEADGDGSYAILRRVRARLPGKATLSITGLDPCRYRTFLHERTCGLRKLVEADHGRLDYRGNAVPEFDWQACRWEGHDVELIVSPGNGRTVLAVGESSEALRAFEAALKDHCDRPEGRALVYSSGRWRDDAELDAELAKASWAEVVLPAEQVGEIRGSVEAFFSHREAYLSFGFAWRRGVLLVGPPGTGKTMVCKAAAASLPDLPFLYVRDLSGYEPEEDMIREIFERARKLAPAILVFEDIDGFVGDHNRAVFLNELDGFRNNEGLLVLASSNHPERVDEALLRRPSRFDRVFRIGLPAEAERREYCRRLLRSPGLAERAADDLEVDVLAEEVASRAGGFTPAHLKEAFVGAALDSAQAGVTVLDGAFAEKVLAGVEALRRYSHESRNPERLADSRDSPELRAGFRGN